jgi:hypothetical protein
MSQNAPMKNPNGCDRRPLAVLSVLLLSTLAAMSASAQNGSLNCKRDFAQIGDSLSAIRQKCGEPVSRDSFCAKPEISGQAFGAELPGNQRHIGTPANVCEPVEEWTYRPGSGQFVTLLRFQNGVLKSIRYAGRIP